MVFVSANVKIYGANVITIQRYARLIGRTVIIMNLHRFHKNKSDHPYFDQCLKRG